MKTQKQKLNKSVTSPLPGRAGFVAHGFPPEEHGIGWSLTHPCMNREKLLAAGCRVDAVDGVMDEINRSATNEDALQQNVWIILDAVDRIAAKLGADSPKGRRA